MNSAPLTPSPVLGEVIVDQLIKLGIKDAVIAPGSRNAPLTMALWRAYEKGLIELHTRIDERSAAFLALGIAKATGLPTPVICTSGSAAANFYPALLEAYHSGEPLIAITADRPARLWQTGANQTTRQVNMFPAAVSETLNLAVDGEQSGQVRSWRESITRVVTSNKPAHINAEFEEPLLGNLEWSEPLKIEIPIPAPKTGKRERLRNYHPHGVIVVGHDSADISQEDIEQFAQTSGWPILSENPLVTQEAIAHTSLLLSDPIRRERLKPAVVMVVGRLTLSRAINSYVASADYQIVVDPRISEVDVKRVADEVHTALPKIDQPTSPDAQWQNEFIVLTQKISEKLPSLIKQWSEPAVARALVSALPHGTTLFVASSRPIRDIEAFAEPRSGIEIFANRGLAGIDGNLATALGIALSRERTYAIVGDLAFLHDINGLLLGSAEHKPNLTIIAISNDGGGIFSTLPQSDVPGFEKIFGTPHGRDLAQVAESYGIDAIAVRTLDALVAQLARNSAGIRVIVCQMPDRASNAQLLKEINDSLALL